MDSGELKSLITIKSWGVTRDAAGGANKNLTDSYDLRAKVEDRQGRLITSHGGKEWSYDYKFTFRYNPDKPVTSKETITFDGKEYIINSISYDSESKKRWCIARTSTFKP